jgi:hypothetical protein
LYLERSAQIELLCIPADERPGRVELHKVEAVAALVYHFLVVKKKQLHITN